MGGKGRGVCIWIVGVLVFSATFTLTSPTQNASASFPQYIYPLIVYAGGQQTWETPETVPSGSTYQFTIACPSGTTADGWSGTGFIIRFEKGSGDALEASWRYQVWHDPMQETDSDYGGVFLWAGPAQTPFELPIPNPNPIPGLDSGWHTGVTYYVRIENAGWVNAVARVTVKGMPTTGNDADSGTDAGETFSTAMSISSGTLNGDVDANDLQDYYKIYAQSGDHISAQLVSPEEPPAADFDLFLYAPSGDLATYSGSTSKIDSIDYDSTTSGEWRLRVNRYAEFGTYSLTTSVTNVQPPWISVSSPNGGESWQAGTAHTISWSSGNSPGSNVDISLYESGSYSSAIASGTSNDGSYSWTISPSQTPSSYYTVRIVSTTTSASDGSDAYFSITASSAGDDSYEPDDTYSQARTITSSSPQSHNINDGGADVDWVKFTLSQTSDIVIETSGASGDTRMWLYDSTGVPDSSIAYNDDNGVDMFSRISTQLSAGTYYVKVDEYNNNDEIPSYVISLTVAPVSSPWITVSSPNGGENWQAGTTQSITWSSGNSPGSYVDIYLYKGGSQSSTIAPGTSNDGSHSWTISPSQTADSDYTVVIASTTTSASDGSDAYFTISAGTTSDDSYEPDDTYTQASTIASGSPQTHSINDGGTDVDWVKFTLSQISDVTIETSGASGDTLMWLYDSSGVPSSSIASDDDGGTGTFSLITILSLSTGTYYVEVRDYGGVSEIPSYTISLTVTPVSLPWISVSSPNGGESWQAGTAHTISWSSGNSPGSYVDISLYQSGSYSSSIVSGTANDGSYSWTISPSQAAGSDYSIVISSTTTAASDGSDAYFSITSSSAGDDSYEPDDTYTQASTITPGSPQTHSINDGGTDVDWVKFTTSETSDIVIETAGASGDTRMWLYDSTGVPSTSIASDDDGGADMFSRISTQIPAGTYYVMVDAYGNNQEISSYTLSLSVTPVSSPWMTVSSPNGGESWQAGTSHTITWSSGNSPGSYVDISLYQGGSYTSSIASGTSNDGSYSWTIPSSQTAGSDYSIVISSTTTAASDSSDAYFSIAASSAGDDSYEVDDTYTQASTITPGSPQTHSINDGGTDVDWVRFTLSLTSDVVIETSGASGDTTLRLYDSSGVPSTSIAYDDDGGTGSFSRITASSLSAGTYYAKVGEYGSNSEITSYTISLTATPSSAPSITVTSPTSSSDWTAGNWYSITWTSSGTGSFVMIEYYHGTYSTAAQIISSTDNDGSYSWSLPSSLEGRADYRIRVTSTSDSTVYGESDTFSVSSSGPSTHTMSLYSAAAAGYVEVTIKGAYSGYGTSFSLADGNGVFFGRCINVEVVSKIEANLDLTIELKRSLECLNGSDIQTMVVTQSVSFTLVPSQRWIQDIYAMCVNMHLDAPSSDTYYTMGQNVTGRLANVVQEIGQRNAQGQSGQCALWAVSDSATADDLKAWQASSSEISDADEIYRSATGESISGVDQIPWSIIAGLAVALVIIVAVIAVALRVGKARKST